MKLLETFRSLIPLSIGLAVGVAGAILFMDSLPGGAGSPEERAQKLELELKRARNRVAALEAEASEDAEGGTRNGDETKSGGRKSRHAVKDGARRIAEDLRAGRPVSPDDIFRTSKPLLRDLAPLFDRMRLKQEQEIVDGMTGELARKYDLSPQNEAALKGWFAQKAKDEAQRWTALITADGTRLEDVIRASRDVRPDEGVDTFIANMLPADQAAAFQAERLAERAARVQQEADMKVQRIDSIVELDDAQRDQIFGIMARGSRDYSPAMALEGSQGDIPMTPGGDRQAAILAILRPEQRTTYEAERQRRRDKAAEEAAAVGLALPADWELLEEGF